MLRCSDGLSCQRDLLRAAVIVCQHVNYDAGSHTLVTRGTCPVFATPITSTRLLLYDLCMRRGGAGQHAPGGLEAAVLMLQSLVTAASSAAHAWVGWVSPCGGTWLLDAKGLVPPYAGSLVAGPQRGCVPDGAPTAAVSSAGHWWAFDSLLMVIMGSMRFLIVLYSIMFYSSLQPFLPIVLNEHKTGGY